MRLDRFRSVLLAGLALTATGQPAAAATETVLYSFNDMCCGYPAGQLRFERGTLYGTGTGNENGRSDYGQVFRLSKSGQTWKLKSVLALDGTDGSAPYAGLIRDSNGAYFGTASTGDAYNGGNVFKLYESGGEWRHATIWAFGGTSRDGALPGCNLVMDQAGDFYGTTYNGGDNDNGTIFELKKTGGGWSESVLHRFTWTDGSQPLAGLLQAGPGLFFGTTMAGGKYGYGTVFQLVPSGGKWKETVLYSFTGGADGREPWGGLVSDAGGDLYGTTYAGGVSKDYSDVGAVFELVRSGDHWREKVLHGFGAAGDGWNPLAGLTWGSGGQLYGTTSEGGSPGGPGVGTVYEVRRSHGAWREKVLHSFKQAGDGSYPQGEVTLDSGGSLYGTTVEGGANNLGAIWKVTP